MDTIELQVSQEEKYFICEICDDINWLSDDKHIGDEVECECCGTKYILN